MRIIPLAIIVAFIVITGAVGCSGCYQPTRTLPTTRLAPDQAQMSVFIETQCVSIDEDTTSVRQFIASGVIVSDRHVLTAAHVISCPGAELANVIVTTPAGEVVHMLPDKVDEDHDLARLVMASGARFKRYSTPVIGAIPSAGDTVCAAVSAPKAGFNCGQVELVADDGRVGHTMVTVHGNSGSGVYDEWGELVGIVSQLKFEQPGGIYVSLWLRNMLP